MPRRPHRPSTTDTLIEFRASTLLFFLKKRGFQDRNRNQSLSLNHPLPAQKNPPFPEEKGPSLRLYRAMGGGGLGVPAAWRRVLHIPGRLASARGRSWRLGVSTSVRPSPLRASLTTLWRRMSARVCLRRRPQGTYAHRTCYFFAPEIRAGQCCV